MERFIKKDKIYSPNIINIDKTKLYKGLDYKESITLALVLSKLAKLEDIEEELGIYLITLFKALKEGFYVKKDSINEGFISLVKTKDFKIKNYMKY